MLNASFLFIFFSFFFIGCPSVFMNGAVYCFSLYEKERSIAGLSDSFHTHFDFHTREIVPQGFFSELFFSFCESKRLCKEQ